MDNLRGPFTDQDDTHDYLRDLDPGDDDIGDELPPTAIGQDERRMQVRVYNFWASMLGERNFPSIEELDPEAETDFGPYSVLLDFTGGIENPAIAFLGAKLADECGTTGPIQSLSDVPSRSLLSRITDHYLQIIANQAPIGFEAEFVNQRGTTILYRGILLPFSSDNDTIDFIYGVINWKELADQRTADELLLQIDQALDPGRRPGTQDHAEDEEEEEEEKEEIASEEEEYELSDWADGPANDHDVLDLEAEQEEDAESDDLPQPLLYSDEASYGSLDLSEPHSGCGDAEDDGLADVLASARDLADEARESEGRTREALYAAISRAYDFSLAAAQDPETFRQIVEDSGLTVQDRAPMTPIVKLVFGVDYDKTRLTEYAAALGHAHRLELGEGGLAGHLSSTPGGLKAVVSAERRLRRLENGKPEGPEPRTAPREKLARKLRKLDSVALSDIPAQGSEFTLLVARRTPEGEIVLLGEVANDVALVEKAARHLLG